MEKITSSNNNLETIFGIDKSIHNVWHKFYKFIMNTYGKDLYGEWQFNEFKDANGKKKKLKYRSFDETEMSRRLVGIDVIRRIEKYITRYIPEIKIIRCDDSDYSGSIILLIPHPQHGITIMFIPQCSMVQNQFFLYKEHYTALMKGLKEMNLIYKNA